jgi:hypothetical protein
MLDVLLTNRLRTDVVLDGARRNGCSRHPLPRVQAVPGITSASVEDLV